MLLLVYLLLQCRLTWFLHALTTVHVVWVCLQGPESIASPKEWPFFRQTFQVTHIQCKLLAICQPFSLTKFKQINLDNCKKKRPTPQKKNPFNRYVFVYRKYKRKKKTENFHLNQNGKKSTIDWIQMTVVQTFKQVSLLLAFWNKSLKVWINAVCYRQQ